MRDLLFVRAFFRYKHWRRERDLTLVLVIASSVFLMDLYRGNHARRVKIVSTLPVFIRYEFSDTPS